MVPIHSGLENALKFDRVRICEAIRIPTVTMGNINLTTAPQDVDWNGTTWKSGYAVIEVNAPEEDAENVATEMSITLSLTRFDLRQEFMNQVVEGKEIKMWLLVLNPSSGVVYGDGVEIASRYLNLDEISRGPQTMEIRILGESILSKQLDSTRAARADAPQQRRYPGDKFFSDVNKLARGLTVTVSTLNIKQRS